MEGFPLVEEEFGALQARLERMAGDLVLDESAAKDLVQEAWLVALQSSSPPGRRPLAWMRTVMRRRSTRQRARDQLRRQREQFAARQEAVDDETVDRASSVAWILSELNELAPNYREVLEMRFIEGRSVREMAEALGTSPETVRSRMSRGLAQLRERLDRSAGSRSAWAVLLLDVARFNPATGDFSATRLKSLVRESSLPAIGAFGFLAIAVSLGVLGWIAWPAPASAAAESLSSKAGEVLAMSATEPGNSMQRFVPRQEEVARVAPPAEDLEESTSPDPELSPDVARLRILVRDSLGAPAHGVFGDFFGRDRKSLFDGVLSDRGELVLDVPLEDLVDEAWLRGGVVVSMRSQELAWSDTYSIQMELGRERRFEVNLDDPSCRVRGVVLDPEGRPVAGIRVDVSARPAELRQIEPWLLASPKEVEVKTDAEGRFHFHGLPPRAHALRVFSPQHPRHVEIVLPEPADVVSEVEVRLSEGGLVGGFVTLPNGAPVPGAVVWMATSSGSQHLGPRVVADEEGFYLLTGLETARLQIFACDPRDPELFASTQLDVVRGEEATFDAVLQRTTGIRVRVVDEAGLPVSHAQVAVTEAGGRTDWSARLTVDGQGRGSLLHLPDEALELRAYRDYRGSASPDAILHDVFPAEEELLIQLDGEVAFDGELRGRLVGIGSEGEHSAFAVPVLFAETDTLPDGRVRFGSAGLRQSSVDADGYFLFQLLSAGRYHVFVLSQGPTGAGIIDVGIHQVVAHERNEIPSVSLPKSTQHVRLRRGPGSWPERTVSIHLGVMFGPYKQPFFVRRMDELLELDLFAGRYLVRVEDGELAQELQISGSGEFEFAVERF